MSAEDRLSPEEEAAAAAAEAGAIGGSDADYAGADGERAAEADRAVEEAGGGESEGFEQAEDALERYASHEDRGGNPAADAFTAEDGEQLEDPATYGEADDALGDEPEDVLGSEE